MSGKLCTKSLDSMKLGTGDAEIQNGIELYAYLFDTFPEMRKYFKGYENYTGADVKKSEHFKKLGQSLILACHCVAYLHENPSTFKAYCRNIIDMHVKNNIHLDPTYWRAFWPLFVDFLAKNGSVDENGKKAWIDIGNAFADECCSHLKTLGLPH